MNSFLRYLGVAVVVIAFPCAGSAHRLDEYLQATRISVEMDCIKTEVNLTPGEAVADDVIAMIDRDRNGEISDSELASYARSVVDSLSLEIDGQRQSLILDTFSIPSLVDMRHGEGVIRLRTTTKIASAPAGRHHLRFAATHRSDIGVYMVNALVPSDTRVQIHGMSRDMLQREFDLDYSIAPTRHAIEIATILPPLLGLALTAAILAFAASK
jgi:hypothetical protein